MSRNIPAKHSVTITDNERGLRDTESGKLIFTEYRGRRCALLLRGGRLTAASFLPDTDETSIGAIYIGKIKNIARNIDACFVEIGEGQVCFLPMKKAATPFLTNRTYDGRLLEGDELLVQIERDAQKTKQPSVTANISISNDYFALMLGSSRLSFSSKLGREKREILISLFTEREILRDGCLVHDPAALISMNSREALLAWEQSGMDFPPVGAIARTRLGEEQVNTEIVMENFFRLTEQMFHLLRTALTRNCYTCLQEAPASWEAVINNLAFPEEYQEIVTDNPELFKELDVYCHTHMPNKELRLYQDSYLSLANLYSLETRLDTALKPRVWLKSGGYLVIEPTEALTVIDVNSGKNDTGRDAAQALCKLNHEAAEEIALQLRLRNLSGIILVDFINMEDQKSGRELLEHLRKLVQFDRVKTTVVDITPLGLVEITRKKTSPPLAEQFE